MARKCFPTYLKWNSRLPLAFSATLESEISSSVRNTDAGWSGFRSDIRSGYLGWANLASPSPQLAPWITFFNYSLFITVKCSQNLLRNSCCLFWEANKLIIHFLLNPKSKLINVLLFLGENSHGGPANLHVISVERFSTLIAKLI